MLITRSTGSFNPQPVPSKSPYDNSVRRKGEAKVSASTWRVSTQGTTTGSKVLRTRPSFLHLDDIKRVSHNGFARRACIMSRHWVVGERRIHADDSTDQQDGRRYLNRVDVILCCSILSSFNFILAKVPRWSSRTGGCVLHLLQPADASSPKWIFPKEFIHFSASALVFNWRLHFYKRNINEG